MAEATAEKTKAELKAEVDLLNEDNTRLRDVNAQITETWKLDLVKLDSACRELIRTFQVDSHIQKAAHEERKRIRAIQEGNGWPTARD